ncbi:MAG: hypothetical protein CVV23_12165 [Ignavibacteriae bacterium HGW-Ignavibacteriae-2]|jgi:hypothetical protein|nr:MAG: hypothetical protein CVV23_12165 [Ignavibacteriae bacterium HGW-Ignavibacteriae-2]
MDKGYSELKIKFEIILIISVFLFAEISAQSYDNLNSEIFTSEDIKSSGIITLNDIFDLSIRWNKSTINGYSNRASGNLLSTFQRQNFLVLVNGQKIELNFLDEQNLDILPFTIDQIDTVIFVNTPRNYKGFFTEKGLIEFILITPSKGFSISAMESIGNKVGDPGPYAYTQYNTPNIDKLGFLTGVSVKTKGENWSLNSNLKYFENFVTDGAIKNRISLLSDKQKERLLGTNLDLSYNFWGGSHKLLFAYSEDADFFFFPPFGNEVPSKRFFRHVGFSGNIPVSNSLLYAYSIIKSINDLGRLDKENVLGFNLKINSTHINSSLHFSKNNFNSAIGINFDKYDANKSGLNNDLLVNQVKLFFDLNFNFNSGISQFLGITLQKSGGTNTSKGYFITQWNFLSKHSLLLSASLSARDVSEDLNYFTWATPESPIFENTEIDYVDFELNKPLKTYTLDFTYGFQENKNTKFSIGGFLRNFKNFYIEDYVYNFYGNDKLLKPFGEIAHNQKLTAAGVNFQAYFIFPANITNKIDYMYQKYLSGTESIINEWEKFPRHKIVYQLNIRPAENFGLGLKLTYLSETFWNEYIYLETQSNSFYNYRLDEKLLLDLSIQKSFWQNKIWTNILFKNIFNQKEYYNPIGVNLGLRFYLIVQLKLNSLFN